MALSIACNVLLIVLVFWLFMKWENAKDRAKDAEDEVARLKIANKFLSEVQTMKTIIEKSRVVRKKDDDGFIYYEDIDDLK